MKSAIRRSMTPGSPRILANYPLAEIALADLELLLRRTPDASDVLNLWPDREMHIARTPATRLFPGLRLLYEIDEPRIVRWHVSARV
jgi:hypothetical protein